MSVAQSALYPMSNSVRRQQCRSFRAVKTIKEHYILQTLFLSPQTISMIARDSEESQIARWSEDNNSSVPCEVVRMIIESEGSGYSMSQRYDDKRGRRRERGS